MTHSDLSALAEATVQATRRRLPLPVRALADSLPVVYHDWPSDEILGEEFEPDILGMFVGPPFGATVGESGEVPPQILLFLENIWDFVEGDRTEFASEVKLTYLHELGHYLGWDEDEVAARGLD
jgi:predicted Zn-dependent protease with MMP-like domain